MTFFPRPLPASSAMERKNVTAPTVYTPIFRTWAPSYRSLERARSMRSCVRAEVSPPASTVRAARNLSNVTFTQGESYFHLLSTSALYFGFVDVIIERLPAVAVHGARGD